MSLIKEIIKYLGARKKYWLLPTILFLVVIGSILIFAQSSPVAPFVYTIF